MKRTSVVIHVHVPRKGQRSRVDIQVSGELETSHAQYQRPWARLKFDAATRKIYEKVFMEGAMRVANQIGVAVDDFVAVKASKNRKVQQFLTTGLQQVQYQSLMDNRIQQTSTRF